MSRLGKYELYDSLGQGAMGTVYRALDTTLDREVALKTMNTGSAEVDPEIRERFYREARACAKLTHPNIVTIFDLGEVGGTAYIAMELLRGVDFRKVIDRNAPLDLTAKLSISMQICEALGHAHRNGIYHRDIKPSNIFLTTEFRPKLLDFGIARLPTSKLTVAGRVLGTPNYMAPEQILGRSVDARSDLFSAAIVIFEFISGVHPFRGTNIMQRIVNEAPERILQANPNLPPALDAIFVRALDKDPEKRYQNADQIRSDLFRVCEAVAATPQSGFGTYLSQTSGPMPGYKTPQAPTPSQTPSLGSTQMSPAQVQPPPIVSGAYPSASSGPTAQATQSAPARPVDGGTNLGQRPTTSFTPPPPAPVSTQTQGVRLPVSHGPVAAVDVPSDPAFVPPPNIASPEPPKKAITPARVMAGAAAVIILILGIAYLTITFGHHSLEPAVATATVIAENTPVVKEPASADQLFLLHRLDHVNIVELPKQAGYDWVKVQLPLGRRGSAVGYTRVKYLTDWTSDKPEYALALIKLFGGGENATDGDMRSEIEKLQQFAIRFPNDPATSQAKLLQARLLMTAAFREKQNGLPEQTVAADENQARDILNDLQSRPAVHHEAEKLLAQLNGTQPVPETPAQTAPQTKAAEQKPSIPVTSPAQNPTASTAPSSKPATTIPSTTTPATSGAAKPAATGTAEQYVALAKKRWLAGDLDNAEKLVNSALKLKPGYDEAIKLRQKIDFEKRLAR